MRKQADVSVVQGVAGGPGPARQVHPADGRDPARRLPLQVSQLGVGGDRQGRAAHARATLHPPGLAGQRRALDETVAVLPQTQAHQQQPRPERTRKHPVFFTRTNRQLSTFVSSSGHSRMRVLPSGTLCTTTSTP